jgi:hypothetical protein
MTVHFLDTGALIVLLNKHKPPLLTDLKAAASRLPTEAIWTPAPVLVEVGQANAPSMKRLDEVLMLAPVIGLGRRVAERAAEGLRTVTREKCAKCSGFIRPTLVDAAVMAVAAEYAEDDEAIVYTQDVKDLELLRDALFHRVVVMPV